MKTFENWTIGELYHSFGLEQVEEMPLLDEWLSAEIPCTDLEIEQLNKLRKELKNNANIWNEDELKFFFISQLIYTANIKSPHYKAFTQRIISAKLNDIKLNGIVDFVLAKGIDVPEKPYFFLHEYKQEKKGSNDPLGQLLVEMLAAKTLNADNAPLYGCYVIGRLWFFVVVVENQYSVSFAYDATQEDIFKIVSILRAIKIKIEQNVAL
jgi:hypothetical protein